METTKAAPTGCYKCGRPGHWSRDCPSTASDPNHNPNPNPNPSSSSSFKPTGGISKPLQKSSEKPKKIPKTRPKLTPELLLSDDGLGYVLRHFPRNFKYHGRGHEVSDLGNLIGLYSDWHSHLLPYYSFEHFVHKVGQVTATKRVKTCLRELRERVARGGDPTKLHEAPVVFDGPNDEQDIGIPMPDEVISEGINPHPDGEPSSKNCVANDIEEDMLHEIYEKATEEPRQTAEDNVIAAADTDLVGGSKEEASNQVQSNVVESSSGIQITEEQKARMEANRLKALERAAARARLSQAA